MAVILVLVLLVVVGVLSWFAWISMQSLLQALTLKKHLVRGNLAAVAGRAAVHGAVRVTRPITQSGFRTSLWYKQTHQQLSGYGRNRHWRTVGVEEDTAGFCVLVGEDEVHIGDHPTELQGTRSQTDYDGSGCLTVGWGGRERTVSRWLPAPDSATVLGDLQARGDHYVMEKDKKVGLLVSPHSPDSAARWEMAKGILGLLLVTAVVIFGIWFYYQNQ